MSATLGRATEVPRRLSRDLTRLTPQYQIARGSRARKTDAKDEIREQVRTPSAMTKAVVMRSAYPLVNRINVSCGAVNPAWKGE